MIELSISDIKYLDKCLNGYNSYTINQTHKFIYTTTLKGIWIRYLYKNKLFETYGTGNGYHFGPSLLEEKLIDEKIENI